MEHFVRYVASNLANRPPQASHRLNPNQRLYLLDIVHLHGVYELLARARCSQLR